MLGKEGLLVTRRLDICVVDNVSRIDLYNGHKLSGHVLGGHHLHMNTKDSGQTLSGHMVGGHNISGDSLQMGTSDGGHMVSGHHLPMVLSESDQCLSSIKVDTRHSVHTDPGTSVSTVSLSTKILLGSDCGLNSVCSEDTASVSITS